MTNRFIFLLTSLIYITSGFSKEILNQKQIRIPVVDMNDFYQEDKKEEFLNTLYDAMTTVGFFGVLNTGVSESLLSSSYSLSKTFFYQDSSYKKLYFDPCLHGQRGFVPSETAKGTKSKDIKEFFHIGPKIHVRENIWPSIEGFEETMEKLFNELFKYSIPLQQAIVDVINKKANSTLEKDFLNHLTHQGDSLMRLIYYPALEQKPCPFEPERYWAAPHTDINFITILPFATEKGLQLEINGRWLDVVVPKDAFIINVGDMLQNISNGLFKSAKHRVLAQESDKERFSIVMFVHPHTKASLKPLQECIKLTGGIQMYAEGTQEEFLWERLLELGIGSEELAEIYSKSGHFERQQQFGRESPQVKKILENKRLL